LEDCKDLFLSYGGHLLAVGCVLPQEKVRSLKQAVNSLADRMISEEHLKRKVFVDATIDFDRFNLTFLEKFFLLSPFGAGNPKPIFMTEKAVVMNNPQKIRNRHAKFLVKQNERVFEAMGWQKPELANAVNKGDVVDLVYSLQVSEYLGEEKLSLSVEDMRLRAR
jgi:single-stranded-DNA-specific exonuclease